MTNNKGWLIIIIFSVSFCNYQGWGQNLKYEEVNGFLKFTIIEPTTSGLEQIVTEHNSVKVIYIKASKITSIEILDYKQSPQIVITTNELINKEGVNSNKTYTFMTKETGSILERKIDALIKDVNKEILHRTIDNP